MPGEQQYVDLQVNGYAGVDFNADDLSTEQLHFACQRLREDRVAGILATIITAELPKMLGRLKRIADICQQDPLVGDLVWGIHIEGPFINENPGYVGAHPPQAVRPGDLDAMKQLLDAGGGLVRLVTLAPERDPRLSVTCWLVGQKILVAAGHCNPSLDELHSAIDAGLSMFTHLGNGCPMVLHRHDNIIQRALSLRERLTISFIADGVHVPTAALGNYLRLTGAEHAIVVTDAIAAARLGPGQYTLGGQAIGIGKDLVTRSADGTHFVGSATTMPRTAALLRKELRLSVAEVQHLVLHNPCRLLGR